LHEVVGRWLDCDREAVATLHEMGLLAGDMTEAVARKDLPEFGRLIDVAWRLNKRLDPNSTTNEMDALLARLGPHIYGAKLLGAGGGGVLFLVCKSPENAARVRHLLETEPPNPRARFFDFALSEQGLAVRVC
jgi:fucokinase